MILHSSGMMVCFFLAQGVQIWGERLEATHIGGKERETILFEEKELEYKDIGKKR